MSIAQTVNNLAFLQHILQRDHGIEDVNESFLWGRIYNDSSCDRDLAQDMLQQLCEDRESLSAFAASLVAVQPQVKVVTVVDRNACNYMLGVGLVIGLIAGLLVGVSL